MAMILFFLVLAGIAAVVGVNSYVKHVGAAQILSTADAAALSDVDCILVLGCRVRDDGTPSALLEDRLTTGIELYELGAAQKLLMSGDHASDAYNEVSAMKQYALDANVPPEDIFLDHAGLSTYASIYRAKELFGADKMIIVTQTYHMYRALYIAKQLGVEAYGVVTEAHAYAGDAMREVREILARCKDCVTCIIRPEPAKMGDPIPLSGSGDVTHDWNP